MKPIKQNKKQKNVKKVLLTQEGKVQEKTDQNLLFK